MAVTHFLICKWHLLFGLLDLVGMSADLARQLRLRIAAALHQPALETLVVHRTYVASAAAGLDEGLWLVGVVTDPAILFG